VPKALTTFREVLRNTRLRLVRDPSPGEVQDHKEIIRHQTDVPIVVAAMKAQTDYLVTFNRRHFIDDPEVAIKSGLRIGTGEDALIWVREELARGAT
jgi:hypothetical protein